MFLIDNLALGIGAAFELQNLAWLLFGCVLGYLAAATPRLGVLAVLALALPLAQKLELLPAMTLLVGIFCGGCGGAAAAMVAPLSPLATNAGPGPGPGDFSTTTASTAPAIVTARRFAASAPLLALIAASIGAVSIALFAPLVTEFAFRFGPGEYFSMLLLGLILSIVLAAGSLTKALAMLLLGLLFAQIGGDQLTGAMRFNFGMAELRAGIGLVPMALGVVTLARIVSWLGARDAPAAREFAQQGATPVAGRSLRRHAAKVVRGGVIGSLFGVVPGGGALLGAKVSGMIDRDIAAVSAVADPGLSPASAIIAGTRTALIPLLALGVPANAALALMIGLMLQHAEVVQVGPQLMTSHPQLFWGLLISVVLTGILLFGLSRPLASLAQRVETLPADLLLPVLGVLCCIGAWSLQGSFFDVALMGVFALLGHLLFRLGCPIAPLLLGFILAPAMESSLRRALELSGGDWSILISRPISAGMLLVGGVVLLIAILPSIRQRREATFRNAE